MISRHECRAYSGIFRASPRWNSGRAVRCHFGASKPRAGGDAMTNLSDSHETVAFQRRVDFPGVEVRTVESSSTAWRAYSAEFEFLSPHSWRGEVWHRQRRRPLETGLVLCAEPGEVYRATRVNTPGTRSCLVIDGQVLRDYVEEHGIPRERLHLRSIAPLS